MLTSSKSSKPVPVWKVHEPPVTAAQIAMIVQGDVSHNGENRDGEGNKRKNTNKDEGRVFTAFKASHGVVNGHC